MNIEIKISGEITDAKLTALVAAITAVTDLTGGKALIAAPAVPDASIAKGPVKAAPKKSVADQVTEALDAAPETEFATTPHDTTKPAEAAPTVKRESTATKSKYTLEVVRAEAIAVSKISNEKREEVKALIATHGGVKVTDLDAEVYDAFMADLAKLK